MRQPNKKSENYIRFRFFSWHIYISRRRLKRRVSNHGDSRLAKEVRAARIALTGSTCEGCGRKLDVYCRVWHLLPKGAPGRNRLEHVRALCGDCYRLADSDSRFQSRLSQEGGAR